MKNYIPLLVIFWIAIGCSKSNKGELFFIEPKQGDKFNFPYFLFIPNNISPEKDVFIIVEPNNSGFADDNIEKHIEKAERIASKDFYLGNYGAINLGLPLIVPVFPRPKTEWKIYTHALDRDVMLQKENPLERLDVQLIEMFNDARSILKIKHIKTKEKFLMTGFSASGTFANRFTLIHPEKVYAAAAGGVNGLLMLPLDSLQNNKLQYPIGTGDMAEILSKNFQKEIFLNIPQFYFMGENDNNDAIQYEDGYSKTERSLINKLFGKNMLKERWIFSKNIYINQRANVIIKTYKNTGHEQTLEIKNDVVKFFKETIDGN